MSKVIEKIIDIGTGRKEIKKIEESLSKLAKSRPKGVNHFLKKYPDANIREIRVCRKPIKEQFTKIMNWVSGGELEKVKKKYDYDDIFHLYAFLILDNGKKFFVEKNEVVVMKEYRGRIEDKHMDCKSKQVSPMKFKDFVKKAEKSYKNIYLYSAHNDNCQKFVRHLANTLGIKELDSFIMQYNAGEILKGSVKENAKKVTTMANIMARLFGAFSNDFVEDERINKKKKGRVVRQKDRRKNMKAIEQNAIERKRKQKERKEEILAERKARKGR